MKTKLKVRLTPVAPSMVIAAGDGNMGSTLGDKLIRELGLNPVLSNGKEGTITRKDHQDYIRGLRDGGVLLANRLYDMLCTHEQVKIVLFHEEEA